MRVTEDYLTLKEAAQKVGMHVDTLRRAIRRGALQAARAGGRGHLRLKESWIDKWFTQRA